MIINSEEHYAKRLEEVGFYRCDGIGSEGPEGTCAWPSYGTKTHVCVFEEVGGKIKLRAYDKHLIQIAEHILVELTTDSKERAEQFAEVLLLDLFDKTLHTGKILHQPNTKVMDISKDGKGYDYVFFANMHAVSVDRVSLMSFTRFRVTEFWFDEDIKTDYSDADSLGETLRKFGKFSKDIWLVKDEDLATDLATCLIRYPELKSDRKEYDRR